MNIKVQMVGFIIKGREFFIVYIIKRKMFFIQNMNFDVLQIIFICDIK